MLRRSEPTRFSSASDDKVGGSQRDPQRAEASNQTEEERLRLFLLRATARDSRRSQLALCTTGGRMDSDMRLPTLLRKRGTQAQIGGVARLDRRTKNLTKRLRPGEIAIIHHSDLDRVSAEALVEVGAAAVVNAVSSVSVAIPTWDPAS